MLEAESSREVIESGVDFAEGSLDRVGVAWQWATRRGVGDERGERSEETQAELDEQHPVLRPTTVSR